MYSRKVTLIISKNCEFEKGSRDHNKAKETSSYIASHAAGTS